MVDSSYIERSTTIVLVSDPRWSFSCQPSLFAGDFAVRRLPRPLRQRSTTIILVQAVLLLCLLCIPFSALVLLLESIHEVRGPYQRTLLPERSKMINLVRVLLFRRPTAFSVSFLSSAKVTFDEDSFRSLGGYSSGSGMILVVRCTFLLSFLGLVCLVLVVMLPGRNSCIVSDVSTSSLTQFETLREHFGIQSSSSWSSVLHRCGSWKGVVPSGLFLSSTFSSWSISTGSSVSRVSFRDIV
jgi:hypothetical protein